MFGDSVLPAVRISVGSWPEFLFVCVSAGRPLVPSAKVPASGFVGMRIDCILHGPIVGIRGFGRSPRDARENEGGDSLSRKLARR